MIHGLISHVSTAMSLFVPIVPAQGIARLTLNITKSILNARIAQELK